MAHLVWCWCGKHYRCDIDHPPRGNVLTSMEPQHERNCPDQIIHGNRNVEVKFRTLAIEKFQVVFPPVQPAELMRYIISENLMKDKT